MITQAVLGVGATVVALRRPTAAGGRWDLTCTLSSAEVPETSDHLQTMTRSFDAVDVCNGHYAVPFVPELYQAAAAAGLVRHSHDYRRPDAYAGLRVLVVGAAGSANDIAPEIATVAAVVIRSH